jgi:hypothetical protein
LCVTGYTIYVNLVEVECYDNLLPETFGSVPADATPITVETGSETRLLMNLNDVSQLEGYILAPNGQPLANVLVKIQQIALSNGQHSVASQPALAMHSQVGIRSFWSSPGGGYGSPTVKTDENGYYRFDYIPTGNYILLFNARDYSVSRNSYLPIYYPDTFSFNDAHSIRIESSTRLSITKELTPEARITGKITLPGSTPLTSPSIFLFQKVTDTYWESLPCYEICHEYQYDYITGMYTMTGVIAGTYRIYAQEYMPGAVVPLFGYYGGDSIESADDVVVQTGETRRNINFTLGAAEFDSAISGTIRADGAPQPDIEVGLFSAFQPGNTLWPTMPFVATTTDMNGRYTLAGLPRGYYYMMFRDPAGIYATSSYTGDLSNGPGLVVITQTGTLENINATLTPGGTVRGHVRLQNGRDPSDFAIQLLHYSYDPTYNSPLPYMDVTSDADGEFVVTGIPPGAYYLRAVPPSGGELPQNLIHYYPATADWNSARALTVEAGKTLENRDILFFFTPTNFLPRIGGGTYEWPPGGPLSTATPIFFPTPGPIPTPTPTAVTQ